MNMMQFENESAADSIFYFISGIYLDNTVYKGPVCQIWGFWAIVQDKLNTGS